MRSATQSGAFSPSGRDSFTSSTAWGKRVISERGTGALGLRYHLHRQQGVNLRRNPEEGWLYHSWYQSA